MSTQLATYRQEAADSLRAYIHAEEEDRTSLLRRAAETLVDARAVFSTADGEPDWRGRSYAYRRWVREVYDEASLPRDELPAVQAAVRYHVGNVLRDRLSADELEDLGLRAVGPRERSVEKRTRHAQILALFEGAPISDPEEAEEAVVALCRALSRIRPEALQGLSAPSRRNVRKTLDIAGDHIEALTAATARKR